MKALFIGGTGTISMGIVRRLAAETDWEVWLLNRGNRRAEVPEGVHQIQADISDEKATAEILKDQFFDTVCEFIGFTKNQVERDYRLFKGKTRQYIYISSASAYHKPAASYIITEGTTLLGILPQQDCLRGIPYGEVPDRRLPGYHRPAQPHL